MNDNNYHFQTENVFQKSYEKFLQTSTYNRLQQKFVVKPYYVKNANFRALAKYFSYFFNILSAATACYAVYLFIDFYVNYRIVSMGLTGVFMMGLEALKRMSGTDIFSAYYVHNKIAPGSMAFVVGLILLSIWCSYQGGKKFMFDYGDPPVTILEESYTVDEKKRLAILDEEIAAARATKYRGTTTTKSQATIDKLTTERKELQDRIYKLEDTVMIENRDAKEENIKEKQSYGQAFGLCTCILELIFVFCIWYTEYYDHKSFAEFVTIKKDKADEHKEFKEHFESFLMSALNAQRKVYLKDINQLQISLQSSLENQLKALPIATTSNNDKTNDKASSTPIVNPAIAPTNSTDNSNENDTPSDNSNNTDKARIAKSPRQELSDAIKKTRSKINSSTYRLKNKIGNSETNERNLQEAEQELERLIRRLDELDKSNRKDRGRGLGRRL